MGVLCNLMVICQTCGKTAAEYEFDKDLKPRCSDCSRRLNTMRSVVEAKEACLSVVMNDLKQSDLNNWVK